MARAHEASVSRRSQEARREKGAHGGPGGGHQRRPVGVAKEFKNAAKVILGSPSIVRQEWRP
jgi:hypothetical protein